MTRLQFKCKLSKLEFFFEIRKKKISKFDDHVLKDNPRDDGNADTRCVLN